MIFIKFQILQDEFNSLELELSQILIQNDNLKIDNSSLLQRWIESKNAEADKLNELNIKEEEEFLNKSSNKLILTNLEKDEIIQQKDRGELCLFLFCLVSLHFIFLVSSVVISKILRLLGFQLPFCNFQRNNKNDDKFTKKIQNLFICFDCFDKTKFGRINKLN